MCISLDQQTIKELFTNKKADFLIPDYQRPYAWDENECQTLWDDIFAFAFPNDNYSEFDSENDEYFLGPIVTFKNDDNKQEIIDGQQRLTTLMLLLRAFYSYFGNMQDENSIKTAEAIGKCIWKTDEFGTANKNKLKIDSEVSSDDDKEQFFKEYRFPMDDLFVTEEMKDLLSRVADLAAQASDEVYDDDDDNGTYGILSLCDQLYEKINRYLERDSDD